MPASFPEAASPPLPASLRIRFSAGERPYLFWVSGWSEPPEGRCRYKILSKSLPDRSLDVLVLQEGGGVRRQTVASIQVPADSPAGWLERWVDTVAGELAVRFERFDLRYIENVNEWRSIAKRLGWTLERAAR